jgi:hypothetical protein
MSIRSGAEEMLTAEDIAYWYLRLNGFLVLRNFLVHGDRPGQTRTDIDVFGVRFKYRAEHLKDPMPDDNWVGDAKKTLVVFCEIKRGAGNINKAWRNRSRKMMESFLALVGIASPDRCGELADRLYETGQAVEEDFIIRTLLIHHDPTHLVQPLWAETKVIQLACALRFIHGRFGRYRSIKTDQSQWEPSGHDLWVAFEKNRTHCEEFVDEVLRQISTPLIRIPASAARLP